MVAKDAGRVEAIEDTTPTTRQWPRLRSISLGISPRLREEILAILLFTLAVVLALPLVGMSDGTALEFLTTALLETFGLGAFLLPFAVAIIAVEVWRQDEVPHRYRRLVGGAAAGLAAVGLLALAGEDGPRSDAGGYLGEFVTWLLGMAIGEAGSAISLFAIGVVGVFLVAGSDVDTLVSSWRRIRRRRPIVTEPIEDVVDVSLTSEVTASQGITEPFAVPDACLVDEPVQRRSPVIRVPKASKATKEVLEAVAEATNLLPGLVGSQDPRWTLPSLDLLRHYDSVAPDENELARKARLIEETLESFKVEVMVREVFPGPAVTLFALEPGTGVKVSRITALQNDLALALAAPSIRIEAPVPGMARVGIEIPNGSVATVGMREVMESVEAQTTKAKLPMPLGRDVNGRYVIGDLAKMPHLLIAGSTGSGKSVCINSIIATFLLLKTPDELRMLLIDPKLVEFSGYKSIPHLKGPIVTEMDKVVSALRMVVQEMEQRYQRFAELGIRNLDGYAMMRENEPALPRLPYLVVIIDELADMMMTTPDEVETLIVRIAQKGRAAGIHLILATQRPSVDVLTGILKANVQARIAFAVASLTDSRVVLDLPGAERLLGRGDMLYLPPDAAKPQRIQGSFIDDPDLQRVVTHWRKLSPSVEFEPGWAEFPGPDDAPHGEDPLMTQAIEIVKQQGSVSVSMLQRRLRIGYNRAARLVETMEDLGMIGPQESSGRRAVYDVDE